MYIRNKRSHKYLLQYIFAFGFSVVVLSSTSGCSEKRKDQSIKADIVTKAKTDVNFAGVEYTVDKGVVTLTGTCATEKSKAAVEKTIKSINIINGMVDRIQIAPVVLNADFPLKQSVDSVLANYPRVETNVSQQIVTLNGKITHNALSKLLSTIKKLHPAKVENQLVVD